MKLRVLLYCAFGGVPLLLGALGTGHWVEWWLAGVALALAFIPVALFGPRSGRGQFGALALAMLIITALCTWSEALLFVRSPQLQQHPYQALIGACVLYLLVAAGLALWAKLLHLSRDSAHCPAHGGFTATALLVPLCGITYLVCYFVFGALTYQVLTHAYYPEAATAVSRLGGWFWAIQFARGVLMTLAILPVLYTLRMSRRNTAFVAGAVLWLAGGPAPLLVPNPFLSPTQRLIHVLEIFAQNVPLGITAALLLRRRDTQLLAASDASAGRAARAASE